MRFLLQHARTQLYLRCLGNWTANPLEGHDFQHSQRAIDFAREHSISGVQVAAEVPEECCEAVVLFTSPLGTPTTTRIGV